jgi:UDP-N-acetylmuramate dehydrogenase
MPSREFIPEDILAAASLTVRCGEPMREHTTFKTGGPADAYARAAADKPLASAAPLFRYARDNNIPVQIIGGGANLVVADAGIRGITFDTRTASKTSAYVNEGVFTVSAGMLSDSAAELAAQNSLSGLEFLAGLPGTVGGAVWMNARCWGVEISGVLRGVDVLDENFNVIFEPFNEGDWSYKLSPYQHRNAFILAAHFDLSAGERGAILKRMSEYRLERDSKGHFSYPSAGSVFKNNPAFGKSAGKIIEELGLRGLQIGGARVADWHGNFIVNMGGASSSDIRALTSAVQQEAYRKLGIELEPEILFIGDWRNSLGKLSFRGN